MKIETTSFKIFLVIENLFGIFRNFTTFTLIGKVVALVFVLANWSMCLYVICVRIKGAKDIYLLLITIYSMSCNLLSCYYSKHYVEFLYSLNANHVLVDFKNDKVYSDHMASFFKIGIIRLSIYIVIFTLQIFNATIFKVYITASEMDFKDMSLVIIRTINNFRLHVEFEILSYTYYIISEQLQCITRSVKNKSYYYQESDSNMSIYLGKWLHNYTNVKKSTVLLNEVYGLQLTLSSCVISLRYMTVCYAVVVYRLKDYRNLFQSLPFYALVLWSMCILFTTARAAQQLQNSASALTRALKRLLVQADESEQRDLKQLLHIVSTRPIRIKAFFAIDVNMRLIPACLTLVVSYTVVALQFNNVV